MGMGTSPGRGLQIRIMARPEDIKWSQSGLLVYMDVSKNGPNEWKDVQISTSLLDDFDLILGVFRPRTSRVRPVPTMGWDFLAYPLQFGTCQRFYKYLTKTWKYKYKYIYNIYIWLDFHMYNLELW